MEENFRKYIQDNGIADKNLKLLLAVSGGIDSMVMTDLFLKEGISVAVAHCNFSLRGKDSDQDENFVREYAEKHKIKFFSVRFDTKTFARKNRISIQMAARDLRYKWFEETRSGNGFDLIAVAHNLNDNIETFLVNLARGTGITGLTGMKAANDRIIRPLLFAKRSDIEEYSRKNKIKYREDSSNSETKYTRNKIRHKVIPVFKEINPAFENTLSETIERLKQVDMILAGHINIMRKKISHTFEDKTVFEIKPLLQNIDNETILFELFSPFNINGDQLNDLKNVIKGRTGGQFLSSGYRIMKNRNSLIISPNIHENIPAIIIQSLEELHSVPFIKSVRSVKNSDRIDVHADKSVAFLDENKITYPVKIRHWKKGDYFIPFGMKGRKKLSDYFTDRKLSLMDKEKIMVLETGGKIAWIIGERIDERFRINSDTERVLVLHSA